MAALTLGRCFLFIRRWKGTSNKMSGQANSLVYTGILLSGGLAYNSHHNNR